MKPDYEIDAINNQITFTDARFYKNKEGEFIPSVTTILQAYPKSAHLMKWIRDKGLEGEDYMKERGEIGDRVHQLTEEYDKFNPVELLDPISKEPTSAAEAWALFHKYTEFREAYPEIAVSVNEQEIIDDRWAGTIDRVYHYKPSGTYWLVDIKTSSSVHMSHWLQVAAYAHSRRKLFGTKISKIAILHLRAKTRTINRGKFQGKGWKLESPPIPEKQLFDLWLKVLDLWTLENQYLKPKQLVYQLKYQLNPTHGENQQGGEN